MDESFQDDMRSHFALNGGFADGTKWSYRQLADLEGISHVRAWQIVGKTGKRLREYMESRRAK